MIIVGYIFLNATQVYQSLGSNIRPTYILFYYLQEHANKLKEKLAYFSAVRGKSGQERDQHKTGQGSLFKAHLLVTCILTSGRRLSAVAQKPFCDKGKHELKVKT